MKQVLVLLALLAFACGAPPEPGDELGRDAQELGIASPAGFGFTDTRGLACPAPAQQTVGSFCWVGAPDTQVTAWFPTTIEMGTGCTQDEKTVVAAALSRAISAMNALMHPYGASYTYQLAGREDFATLDVWGCDKPVAGQNLLTLDGYAKYETDQNLGQGQNKIRLTAPYPSTYYRFVTNPIPGNYGALRMSIDFNDLLANINPDVHSQVIGDIVEHAIAQGLLKASGIASRFGHDAGGINDMAIGGGPPSRPAQKAYALSLHDQCIAQQSSFGPDPTYQVNTNQICPN